MKKNIREILKTNVLDKHKFFDSFEYSIMMEMGSNKLEIVMFNTITGKFVTKWYNSIPKINEENVNEYKNAILDVFSKHINEVTIF